MLNTTTGGMGPFLSPIFISSAGKTVNLRTLIPFGVTLVPL